MFCRKAKGEGRQSTLYGFLRRPNGFLLPKLCDSWMRLANYISLSHVPLCRRKRAKAVSPRCTAFYDALMGPCCQSWQTHVIVSEFSEDTRTTGAENDACSAGRSRVRAASLRCTSFYVPLMGPCCQSPATAGCGPASMNPEFMKCDAGRPRARAVRPRCMAFCTARMGPCC